MKRIDIKADLRKNLIATDLTVKLEIALEKPTDLVRNGVNIVRNGNNK